MIRADLEGAAAVFQTEICTLMPARRADTVLQGFLFYSPGCWNTQNGTNVHNFKGHWQGYVWIIPSALNRTAPEPDKQHS